MKEGLLCHVRFLYCKPFEGPLVEDSDPSINAIEPTEIWLPAIILYQGINGCLVAYMDLEQNLHRYSPIHPHIDFSPDNTFYMIEENYRDFVKHKLRAYYHNYKVPEWLNEVNVFAKKNK